MVRMLLTGRTVRYASIGRMDVAKSGHSWLGVDR
jgi:hypothetical protein